MSSEANYDTASDLYVFVTSDNCTPESISDGVGNYIVKHVLDASLLLIKYIIL